MKHRKHADRYTCPNKADHDGDEVENAKCDALQKPSHELLAYYKNKAARLEKEFDNLSELLDNIKSACDLSTELQGELVERNEEVSRLQQVISDLQIHLFREREHCLKLSAENDRLKIQEFEDRKKINALLMLTGSTHSGEMVHFLPKNSRGFYVERKLPQRLQQIRDERRNQMKLCDDAKKCSADECEGVDPQVLILRNHSLAAQLEHHICISRDQIQVLLKDQEIAREERQVEQTRLQREIHLLSGKLKQVQDNLCETSSRLVKCQQNYERERSMWMEEKDKYTRALRIMKERHDEKYPDVAGYSVSGVGCKKARNCAEAEFMKEQMLEKEQIAAAYQEQIIAMEAEINRLRERAQGCRKNFKEKMDKMSAQTAYLRNKYEELDRRRQLEAEGFRTDIKMLRERLKELEKKLTKANLSGGIQPCEQQLLNNARSTLNRARQLEKELLTMKSKMALLGINEYS